MNHILFSDGRPNKLTTTDPQQSVIPRNASHARGKAPGRGGAIVAESPKAIRMTRWAVGRQNARKPRGLGASGLAKQRGRYSNGGSPRDGAPLWRPPRRPR